MIRRILPFICICFLFSCRTAKEIVEVRNVPNINEGRLYRNISENELEYSSLYSKKVDISLNRNGKKDNLNGSLKIKKDEFIWMSMTGPLGIEVSRILLTPDSIKIIDPYNKKYFFTDYQYIYDKLEINLDYDCIQSLLTNTFFDLEKSLSAENNKDSKFKFEKTDMGYELSNIHSRAIDRKIRKFYKKKNKNKEFSLILQRILINPELFRPEKISLEEVEEDMKVSVNYSNFKDYEGIIFPARMVYDLIFEDTKISVDLKFSRLEFNVPVTANFKLSSKYEPLVLNQLEN